tara:strand:+ start:606 stop:1895 length:1290 start_codon:yes stop_codon:yes gene_type:complete
MSDVGLACNKVAGCVGAVNAIPDGWSLDKLENFVTNKILGTTSRGTGLSNVLLLKMGNLKGGRINYDKVEYVENKEELQSLTLEYGDFLFNTRNTPELVGKVSNFCEKRLKAVYDNNLLRLKFNDYIDPIYMGYLFNLGSTVQQLKQIVAGTTSVAAIYWKDLALLKQIVPPLPEQQKIAQILTSVDEVIEKTQAQIDKLKDLKTAMMQELLTKGIGHLEFKDSPMGRIPVGWEVVKFSEIFIDYKYGPRFSSKDYDLRGNVKTIRGTDVSKSGKITYQQVPTAKIDANVVESHALKEGDLVMITTADCGATAIFHKQKISYIASAYAIKLSPKNDVDSQFILYFMQTSPAIKQVESFIRKGTVANLPGSDVMNIKLALPSLDEQRKISNVLLQLDGDIELKEEKVKSSINMKKALMQDLLTGKVRVDV